MGTTNEAKKHHGMEGYQSLHILCCIHDRNGQGDSGTADGKYGRWFYHQHRPSGDSISQNLSPLRF